MKTLPMTGLLTLTILHGRRPGAEFWGTKKFFRGPISGQISIFRVKISDDFLVIDPILRIFHFFSHIFHMFTMLNVVYMTISSQEKHNFSLCSCFHEHPTTLLLKILGRTNAWAVPHLKFFLGPSPQPP